MSTESTPLRRLPLPGGGAGFFAVVWLVLAELTAIPLFVVPSVLSSARGVAAGGAVAVGEVGAADGAGGRQSGDDPAGAFSDPTTPAVPSAAPSAPTFTAAPSPTFTTVDADGLLVTGVPVAGAPEAAVAQTLITHGQAINTGDYRAGWALFSPRLRERSNSLDDWRAGVATSHWVGLDLRWVTINSDGTASVGADLRTTQAPEAGDGHGCLDWTLTYTLLRDNGRWLIDKASGSSTPC